LIAPAHGAGLSCFVTSLAAKQSAGPKKPFSRFGEDALKRKPALIRPANNGIWPCGKSSTLATVNIASLA